MCGIAFLYDPDLGDEALVGRARRALDRLRHRGPDDGGLARGTGWSMAHRRLAIINPDDSRQPMPDASGRFHLSYNGEIYNYRELRAYLEAQWTFVTEGDTEVLLAGLVLEGSSFLERAEGMWAFALWDVQARHLLLGRDRMGQKPLYYAAAHDTFACGSELPALRACASAVDWSEDPDSTADYLRYGFNLPGTTAYRGVRELLPGHVLAWCPGSEPELEAYWNLVPGEWHDSLAQARSELRNRLVRAVDRRMIADVEVGTFLSGGVDSSLIAGILSEELARHPKTFTIGFGDRTFDERHYARIAAERFGTEHYERIVHEWNRDKLVRLLTDHVGQPFADSSLLPTAEVSALAAEHVKVALSGDGADELFSGYQRYQARVLLQWYTRLPQSMRAGISRSVRSLREPMDHHSRSLLKKTHLFLNAVDRSAAETPYVAPRMLTETQLRELAPDLAGRGHEPPGLPAECGPGDLARMMVADCAIYLPQDILAKVDRASMAHGLEARSPFLDSALVRLAMSLPTRWHRAGTSGKRSLRAAFADLLPGELRNRRKQGFAVPVHAWFRDALGHELKALLARDADGPLEPAPVRTLLDEHTRGARDHSQRLWATYVYLLWRDGTGRDG